MPKTSLAVISVDPLLTTKLQTLVINVTTLSADLDSFVVLRANKFKVLADYLDALALQMRANDQSVPPPASHAPDVKCGALGNLEVGKNSSSISQAKKNMRFIRSRCHPDRVTDKYLNSCLIKAQELFSQALYSALSRLRHDVENYTVASNLGVAAKPEADTQVIQNRILELERELQGLLNSPLYPDYKLWIQQEEQYWESYLDHLRRMITKYTMLLRARGITPYSFK